MSLCETKEKTLLPSLSGDSAARVPRSNKGKPLAATVFSEAAQKRFWELVEIKTADQCWLWTAGQYPNGSGIFRGHKASRVAYAITKGDIPALLLVCHTCDNPLCVNPNHLFLGTTKDNAQDALRKGRLRHQRITHCPHGHPYTGNNLIIRSCGRRRCRTCKTIADKNRDRRTF